MPGVIGTKEKDSSNSIEIENQEEKHHDVDDGFQAPDQTRYDHSQLRNLPEDFRKSHKANETKESNLITLDWQEGHRQHDHKEVKRIPMPFCPKKIFQRLHPFAHNLKNNFKSEDKEDDDVKDYDGWEFSNSRISLCTNKNPSEDDAEEHEILKDIRVDNCIRDIASDNILFPGERSPLWINTLEGNKRMLRGLGEEGSRTHS